MAPASMSLLVLKVAAKVQALTSHHKVHDELDQYHRARLSVAVHQERLPDAIWIPTSEPADLICAFAVRRPESRKFLRLPQFLVST